MAIKAAVLFSGGLDSTTMMYKVKEDNHLAWDEILAINIRYGQKHEKEVQMARALAAFLGVKFVLKDLFTIFADSDCTLLQGREEVPTGTYAEQGEIPSTYVPFRNGVFLSVAASIALQHGAQYLYYGAHKDDARAAYPDCTENFATEMGAAIYAGSGEQLFLYAPFISSSKAAIVKEGLTLNVPFEKTWSCYKGGEVPCGICATCVDRAKAFAMNGWIEDYENGRYLRSRIPQ